MPDEPPSLSTGERSRLLGADDAELLRECRTDRYRGSGRGGQKRNVTDSAVRVTHQRTGISAWSDATRSQQHNRRAALRLLRRQIALVCRCTPIDPPPTSLDKPALDSPRYPLWLAHVLDVLEAHHHRLADSANRLGTTTSQLVKSLHADPAAWQHVNRCRQNLRLPPLRPK